MATVSTRRKLVSVAAAATVWISAIGCGAAVAGFLQDGPFAGRGDHKTMTMTIARIIMAQAEAPAAVPDPFVVR